MSFRTGRRLLDNCGKMAARASMGQRRGYQSATKTKAIHTPNQSKFMQFYKSEVGPKTVHFWAPVMKWGLVIAGATDFARPAENLLLGQNTALTFTGVVWTRWCFIIKPRNLFLALVNFFVFCVGATQVVRVLTYRRTLKKDRIL